MKTTMDLPDALLREVREVARREGIPMRDLMVEGLRSELERRRRKQPRVDFHFPTVDGEWLAPGLTVDDAVRMSYDLPPA